MSAPQTTARPDRLLVPAAAVLTALLVAALATGDGVLIALAAVVNITAFFAIHVRAEV
jgi:hypothetical protein